MAPPKTLTDYERRRLDTIRRNRLIIATALPPWKKPKPDSPPRRRSLRNPAPLSFVAFVKTLSSDDPPQTPPPRKTIPEASPDPPPEASPDLPPENAVQSSPSSLLDAPETLPENAALSGPSSPVTANQAPVPAKRPWNRIRVDPKHHRHSLRVRGASPPPATVSAPPPPEADPSSAVPVWKQETLLIRDALLEAPNYPHQLDEMLAAAASAEPILDVTPNCVCCGARFDPRSSLSLRPENTVKVGGEMIFSISIFPFANRTVVACGNACGQVGIWDAGFKEKDIVYLYTPHSSYVSGISIHPFSPTKMYTASDGFVRLMDVKKERFDMVYSTESHIYSICQSPHDLNSLYIGEGRGELRVWDERTGKALSSWIVHEKRIHTIDFNCDNPNLMVTSSSDNTACIWDLRKMKSKCPEWVKAVHHRTPVHSAYFSPSGSSLATTSVHDKVRLLSGANFEDECKLNQTAPGNYFRAIWGWDDSYLYMGNKKKAIDVISTVDKKRTTLNSPQMTLIPYRFAAHPLKEGSLACASSNGKVYLWTKS